MSRLAGAGMVALSALLYAAAFPPTSFPFLIWIGLAPLLAVLGRCRTARQAGAIGAVWALVMTLFVGRCLPPAVEVFHEQSLLAGWLLLAGAGLLTAVPQYALFAVVFRALAVRYRAGLPIFAGAAWAAAEWARVELPPGNPWAIAGLATVDMSELAGMARVTGVYGLSFLVAATNTALVLLVGDALSSAGLHRNFPAPESKGSRTTRRPAAIIAAIAVAFLVAFALCRSSRPAKPEAAPRTIAIVQPALPPDRARAPDDHRRRLQSHLDLTAIAVEESQPDVVVWPESSLGFFLEQDGPWRNDLQLRAPLAGAELIAGGPRLLGSGGVANSLFLLGPGQWPAATYDKQVLLPLGEWFPANSSALLRRDLGAAPQTYATGMKNGLLPTTAGQIGPAICNEIMVPGILRAHINNGAGLLLNPANDAWFPHTGCPLGLFQIARMRAIEHGRWLVRASSSGPSAIIDPSGQIVAQVPIGKPGWAGAAVPEVLEKTFYSRWGDLFGAASLLVVLLALWRRPFPAVERSNHNR